MIIKLLNKYSSIIIFFIIAFVLSFITSTSEFVLSFDIFGVISFVNFILICFIIAPRVITHLKKHIRNNYYIYLLVIIVGVSAIKLGELLFDFLFDIIFLTSSIP